MSVAVKIALSSSGKKLFRSANTPLACPDETPYIAYMA
jgi:hypothetical protein